MSEGADSGTVQISEDSCKSTKNDGEHDATAATTTPSSSSSLSPAPAPPPPPSGPPSQPQLSTTTSTGRRPRFGTGGPTPSPYMWIDGRQLRSALAWTKKSLPRRVSFPSSDNYLVTGYLEPANPWQHAENVNHEDLIFAYKESCARHNTEPLQNVLVQLENLDMSQDRCEELNLKGEILNQDNSEPLEEILKRVQFKKINLEGTSLSEESATILFDMLEYYESVRYLNISSNPEIGVRGWQACSHMIKKTQCLEQLEARDIMFNEQNMNILSRALRLVSHLHVLKLENCGLSGRAIVSLVTALKMNSGIRELYLADNGLNFHDAIQLGSLLRMNNHLQLLDISNNNVQDDGVRDILEGLINQVNEDKTGKGLSILILWNNRLTKKSSSYFSRIIALSKTLETLNIGQNMLTDETLSTVNESLKKNRVLLQLGMQSTELTCDGIITLADIMETNQVLQRIDLRDNTIQMRGMSALVNVMKKNKTITQIDLDDKPRIKIDGPLHEYIGMVTEIRSCCSRNEERRLLEESTEDAESPQNANSRKISLTCQTLPTPPSRSATSLVADEPTARAMLEPKRTSGGRLRSPAPSPIPSPVASPIPSPSRNRFVVCRVPEASLRSTDSSASSSPVTPPSLGSSPCFFHNANSGSSRFRVSVVESTESRSSPQSVVASSSGSSITIGFNVTVHTNDSDNVDSSTDTAIKADSNDTAVSVNTFNVVSVAEKTSSSQDVAKNKDCCEKKSINEKTQSDERIDATMLPRTDEIVTCENERHQETGEKEEVSAQNNVIGTLQSGRDENITANCENTRNNVTNQSNVTKDLGSVATTDESTEDDCITYTSTKELQVPAYPNKDTTLTKITVLENEIPNSGIISSLNEESELCPDQRTSGELSTCVEESSKTSTTSETSLARATESHTQEQVSTSVQRHKSNLEKLLSLFQHPGHLFSNEVADTKSSLQENVSNVMTLGDKLQQYLKETRAKVSTDNSSWYSSEHESPSKSRSMKRNVQQLQNLTGIFASFKLEPHASLVEHGTKLLGQIKNQDANIKEKDYERSTRIVDVAKVDENLSFDQEKNQIMRNNGTNNNDTEKSQITKNDESNLFDEERNQIKRNDERDLVSEEGNQTVRNDENNLVDQKNNQVLNNEKNLIDQAGIQIVRIDEKENLENQKKKQTDENVNESFEIEDKNKIVQEITESEDLTGGRQNKIATDDLNNWERVSAKQNQDSEDCKEIRIRENNKYSINTPDVNVSENVCSVNNLQCTQFNLSNRPLPDSVQSKDNFADNVVLDGGCIATNAASSFISEDTYKSVACIDIKLANKYKYKHCALELSKTDKAGCKNARCCENSVSDDEDKGERNSTQDSKLVEHNDAERLRRDNSEILDNNDNATCSERKDAIGEANVLTVKRTCDTTSTDSINQTSDSSFLIYNIAHDRKAVNNSVSIASTSTCATADDDAMIQSTPDKSETSSVGDVETLSTALKDVDVNEHLKEEITSNTCCVIDQDQRCDFTTEETKEDPTEILDDACRDTRYRRSTSVNIKIEPHESELTSSDIRETSERHCERQPNMPNNVNIHRTKETIETVDYPENSTDDDKRIDPTILVTPYEASATLDRSDAEELIFCMTDISTDGTSLEDELSPSITSRNSPNDVVKATESFFELPALRTTSTTTLLIENPEDIHRNSQDSGIEEAILAIVDAVETADAHPLPLPRSSLQESVDSGIESECSSLCVKVESAAERTSESVAVSKKTSSRDYNIARDRDDDDAGNDDDDDDDDDEEEEDEDNDDGGDDNDVNDEFEEFTSDFLARDARLVDNDNVNDDIAHSYLNSIKYTVVNTTRSVADIASSAPLGVAATADEDDVAHSATSVVAHSPTTVHDTSPK